MFRRVDPVENFGFPNTGIVEMAVFDCGPQEEFCSPQVTVKPEAKESALTRFIELLEGTFPSEHEE